MEVSSAKRYICTAAVFVFILFSASVCRPLPIEELNWTYSSFIGIRMTVTDMYVEPYPLDDSYLLVTTCFLVENTTRGSTGRRSARIFPVWTRSSYAHYGFSNRFEGTYFYFDDLSPDESAEVYVSMKVGVDVHLVYHSFFSYWTSREAGDVIWLIDFHLELELGK